MELQALGSSVAVTELVADINIINHALAWDCDLDVGMGQSLRTSRFDSRGLSIHGEDGAGS